MNFTNMLECLLLGYDLLVRRVCWRTQHDYVDVLNDLPAIENRTMDNLTLLWCSKSSNSSLCAEVSSLTKSFNDAIEHTVCSVQRGTVEFCLTIKSKSFETFGFYQRRCCAKSVDLCVRRTTTCSASFPHIAEFQEWRAVFRTINVFCSTFAIYIDLITVFDLFLSWVCAHRQSLQNNLLLHTVILHSANHGGTVTVNKVKGQDIYAGSMQHGITSQSYAAWPGSFTFQG